MIGDVTLERWAEGKAVGVSTGGFCEVLQGSTARGEGVVILTGTCEIISDKMKAKFPAVYRRIHSTGELTWMSQADIGKYFRKFLERFVPKMTNEKWEEKESQFLGCPCWSPGQDISIDMLKQFLMRQITESKCQNLGDFLDNGSGSDARSFRVSQVHLDQFFNLVCDGDSAKAFLEHYAPVHVSMPDPTRESVSQ